MKFLGSFKAAKQVVEDAKKDVRRPQNEVAQQRAKKNGGQQQGGGRR